MQSMRAEIVHRRRPVLGPVLCVAAAALLVVSVPVAHAQANLGGHIGFVLPLVTHAAGQTTNISDHFSIGFPLGITFKGRGRMAYDLELVPGVQGTPRQTNLTVHPGFVWNVGHNFGVGLRGAFDINSPQWGFTPLVNHSWPIDDSFFKAYFVQAVLPVRFNRPTNGTSTTPVTFGLHFGLGF
jgi:hypothetical protein